MNGKFQRLWKTKNKNDEWWSSFVTSPLAILINYMVVDFKWLTPNLITLFSLITALVASGLIVLDGKTNFYVAAALINISHILDCMDGQMAKYRDVSSRFGNFFDKVTDQIQIFFWFSAIAFAAYSQTQDVVAVFLAFAGVTFYSLRVYVKYVTIFIEIDHDMNYLKKASKEAAAIDDQKEEKAGLGYGWRANLIWFIREQRKFFLFNEAVFVFLLSVALIFDALMLILWVFALSQLYYGVVRSWQRGRQIYLNQHKELLTPIEK
jgi:phosphatidylglycerophosphate synthase